MILVIADSDKSADSLVAALGAGMGPAEHAAAALDVGTLD